MANRISSVKRDQEFRYMIKDQYGDFYQRTTTKKDGLEYDIFVKPLAAKCYKSLESATADKNWLERMNSEKLEVVKVGRKTLCNKITPGEGTTFSVERNFVRIEF